MRKKTADNLSGVKGRSKIPNDLHRWMEGIEQKFRVDKVDLEYSESILRAIYYINENNMWKVLETEETTFTPEQADDFFESTEVSKADFLIQLIDDHNKIKSMLDKKFK